jgi:hypothetical protein
MDEFYGRVMPAPPARIREEDFVPLAQLYGREARVFTDDWREITPPQVAWHENDLAQLVGPRAWYVVEQTNDRIEAARVAGGTVVGREEGLAVHVAAAVTHTIGGLEVDTQARVVGTDGLWAAGVDAGGVATGGYASGLAQALVLGLAAAESIAAGYPARYAQMRRSPGSGDGASFVTRSCLPSTSTLEPTDGASPSCSTSS